ncbi:MAG: arsenate reductase ArsC [Deltaproteobacteria bacterium]|nr:arsenate reductase ArsC [Deltaproteobacteria bacterium]
MKKKLRLLFLCTGNSCRSQMAEGLCHHLRGDVIESYSAGIIKHGLNPLAVKVMHEIGIDISEQQSKTIDDLNNREFEYVVTLCDRANETCPFFPAKTKVTHQGFDDPPKLAAGAGSEEEALSHYRRVRDEIKSYILTLPEALDSDESNNPNK